MDTKLAVDSLAVAAAEHIAQRHCQILQVQARPQQCLIWQARHPSEFANAYAKRVWQDEGLVMGKKGKMIASSRILS
jgi:hypothetical protein